ncbi:MAG TPA: hypothetical protein VMU56_03185 [Beijerinckiaceae bacterium]|nr:hypothetical protein [Beijerinckiaceae bacterium]
MTRSSAFASLLALAVLAGASLALAKAGDDGAGQSGRTLRLPGLPPIPLPPGARVFGPGGPRFDDPALARRDKPVAPRAERPLAPHRRPPERTSQGGPQALRARLLDTLFQRLRKSDDDNEAEGVAGAIERVWLDSGSDTADLLMSRAIAAMRLKKYSLSQTLLGKIVEIDPKWSEAWNQRATVRFLAKDFPGAMADLDHVLALEPRQFEALAEVGFILRSYDKKKDALLVFRKVLQLYPRLEIIKKIVGKLQIEVEGRDI